MFFRYDLLNLWCLILCMMVCIGCDLDEDLVAPSPLEAPAQPIREAETPLYAASPSPYADSLLAVVEDHIEAARYDSAVHTTNRATEVYKQIDYKEGLIRSAVLHADALERWGKYDEALGLLHENLDLGYEWLEEDHLLIGDIFNKLGIINRKKGNFGLAIEQHFNALSIRKNRVGDMHYLVGRSNNNIGVIHAELGDFDSALEYYDKALEIRIRDLGENSKDVAQGYNNIAVALKNKGDYDESLLYHERALSIRKGVFGDIHPAVAASYYNMGVTYGVKGQFQDALENHEKSLAIWTQVFPNGHPLISNNLTALSSDSRLLKRYDEALEYEKRSLEEVFESLGERHIAAGFSYQNIGQIFQEKGEYDKALDNYLKVVDIWKHNSIKQHPSLAKAYCSIGYVYHEQGIFEEALRYVDLCFQANHLDFLSFSLTDDLDLSDYSSDYRLLDSMLLRARIYVSLAEAEEGTVALEAAFRTYQVAVQVIEDYSLSFKK